MTLQELPFTKMTLQQIPFTKMTLQQLPFTKMTLQQFTFTFLFCFQLQLRLTFEHFTFVLIFASDRNSKLPDKQSHSYTGKIYAHMLPLLLEVFYRISKKCCYPRRTKRDKRSKCFLSSTYQMAIL